MSVQKCYLYKHYLRNIMLEKASFNQQIINDYEYYVIFNCLTFSLMSITTFPNAGYFINNSPQMYKFQLPLSKDRGFFFLPLISCPFIYFGMAWIKINLW